MKAVQFGFPLVAIFVFPAKFAGKWSWSSPGIPRRESDVQKKWRKLWTSNGDILPNPVIRGLGNNYLATRSSLSTASLMASR
jgi:hypothetical protein